MIVYENGDDDRNEILALKIMRIFCIFAVDGNVGKGGQKIDVLYYLKWFPFLRVSSKQ